MSAAVLEALNVGGLILAVLGSLSVSGIIALWLRRDHEGCTGCSYFSEDYEECPCCHKKFGEKSK
jgi:hypothetical protein